MRAGRQAGSMLVVALWALSLLGVFSISLGFGVRQKAALLSRLSTLDAVYPIAYSGVELAKGLVKSDDNFDVDLLGDPWASGGQGAALSGGRFLLVPEGPSPVVDEERKVNLNRTSLQIVSRLLGRVSGLPNEEADELAYNLLDWMDSDSSFGHPQYGAEDSYYDDLPRPYAAKDAPYESMDELLLVKGMTPGILEKIRPFVTVYGSGKVNLNTASRDVLAALGFSPLGVETIAAHRAGDDKEDGTSDDRFFTSPGAVASDIAALGATQLDSSQTVVLDGLAASGQIGVASTAFSVRSVGTLERNGASVEVEAVFDRKGQVLYHRTGGIRWPARV
jgi:general secretion pathway protein K